MAKKRKAGGGRPSKLSFNKSKYEEISARLEQKQDTFRARRIADATSLTKEEKGELIKKLSDQQAARKEAAEIREIESLKEEKFAKSRTGVAISKIKRIAQKTADSTYSYSKKRIRKPRRILKKQKLIVSIPASTGKAPYIPTFMTYDIQQEKRSMFFD